MKGVPFVNRRCTKGVLLFREKWYTAVSRKVVGKSARDNPERYCEWFCLPCSPKKFERMAGEATDICWRVLMESNKSRFDSYSREEQCIDPIPYYLSGLSCARFFDNLSRNSCIWTGGLPHLSRLPFLPGVPFLHVNRP